MGRLITGEAWTLKVYVSVDMEGITGLVDAEDVQPRGRDYERGRVLSALLRNKQIG